MIPIQQGYRSFISGKKHDRNMSKKKIIQTLDQAKRIFGPP